MTRIAGDRRERLRAMLADLKIPGALEPVDGVLAEADSEPPGVGKTHLAISLAIAAAESGRRVYYSTLAGLVESLAEANASGKLARRLRLLAHPTLMVVDEIGFTCREPGRGRCCSFN